MNSLKQFLTGLGFGFFVVIFVAFAWQMVGIDDTTEVKIEHTIPIAYDVIEGPQEIKSVGAKIGPDLNVGTIYTLRHRLTGQLFIYIYGAGGCTVQPIKQE